MKKIYNITQNDYENLWSGKVKYLILRKEDFTYGSPKRKFKYYSIAINSYAWHTNIDTWNSKEDIPNFIKEKELEVGDVLRIFAAWPMNEETRYPMGDMQII